YAAADWTVAAWAAVGVEARDTTLRVATATLSIPVAALPGLPALLEPITSSQPDSATEMRTLTVRTTLNAAGYVPGWSVTFAQSDGQGKDAAGVDNRATTLTTVIAYSNPIVSAALSVFDNRIFAAVTSASSITQGAQLAAGVPFGANFGNAGAQ